MNEKYKRILKEKVAAGLRNCSHKPVCLLWIDRENIIWDEPTILGIPVYIVSFIVSYNSSTGFDVPIFPAWGEGVDAAIEDNQFCKGFSDVEELPDLQPA